MLALGLGSNLASASTITPTHDVHHVTGTTTVNTIVAPSPTFCGVVTFLTDSGVGASFSNTGNISRNVGSSASTAYMFVYDPGASKWYPVID